MPRRGQRYYQRARGRNFVSGAISATRSDVGRVCATFPAFALSFSLAAGNTRQRSVSVFAFLRARGLMCERSHLLLRRRLIRRLLRHFLERERFGKKQRRKHAARIATLRENACCRQDFLPILPQSILRDVFLLLAVDQRLRCSEVSLAWRALLADTSFWKRLDLSSSSDVASFSVPLFRAVVAKAGGQLICLDVTGRQEEYLSASRGVL